jgi:hypothetical protein
MPIPTIYSFSKMDICMAKLSRSENFSQTGKKSQSQSQQSILLMSAVRQHDDVVTLEANKWHEILAFWGVDVVGD